ADRFLMSKISKNVLPYLKNQSMPEELLEYALIVADRVHNNHEIIPGLARLFDVERRLEASEKEKNELAATSEKIQSELEKEKKKKPNYVKMKKLMESDDKKTAGFHLICYDSTRKTVEHEDYFYAPFLPSIAEREFRSE
ncbi:hypothetical protein PFISCL1PPCAC_25590, partial [Pristionchus fissidentatus]